MQHYDIIIIGGGASGLFCASRAAQGGKRVLVLEHNARLGRKLLASGGGNCNFTNLEVNPADYQSQNPHFCKSALARFSPQDFLALLDQHQVKYHEKHQGQLFSSLGAERILKVLLEECRKAQVETRTQVTPSKVETLAEGFLLKAGDQAFTAANLVLATGGLSYRGLGASDFGLRVAAQLGLARVPTAPALVPLQAGGYKSLAGVSLPVEVMLQDHRITEDLLFTHWGLSGPAILQASLVWRSGLPLKINLLPGQDLVNLLLQAKQTHGGKHLSHLLNSLFPARLAEFWLAKEVGLTDKKIAELSQQELCLVAQRFQAWSLVPQGTEGYAKAEVTRGGVDTQGLSAKTMEAKQVKGLYLIGELLDVTGRLGGFNLHWAWASGHAAGQALAGL